MKTSPFALFGEGATVDYNKALADYYTKDLQQLENYGAELAEVGRQEVDKAKAESLVNVASSLASFSTSLGNIARQSKVDKENKINAYQQRLRLSSAFQENEQLIRDVKRIDFHKKRGTLSKADSDLDKTINERIKKLRESHPEFAASVLDVTGWQQVAVNQLLATNAVNTSQEADYLEELRSTGNHKETEAYEAADHAGKNAKFTEWELEKLAHLKLSDDFIIGLVGDEITRKGTTLTNLHRSKAGAQLSSDEDRRYTELLYSGTLSTKEFPSLLKDIRNNVIETKFSNNPDIDEDTKQKKANDYLYEILTKVALDKSLPTHLVSALEDTKADDHPAGKDANILQYWGKDKVNMLVTLSKIGDTRALDVSTNRDKGKLAQAIALKREGLTAEADAIFQGVKARNFLPTEAYNAYEGIKVEEYTETAFNRYDADMSSSLKKGTLHERITELESHPNNNIKEKYLHIAKQAKKFFDENKSSFDKEKIAAEYYKLRTGESLTKDTVASIEDGQMAQIFIDRSRRRVYELLANEEYADKPYLITATINQENKQFFNANGGGTVITQKDIDNGKELPGGQFTLIRDNSGQSSWGNLETTIVESSNIGYNHDSINPNREANYIKMKNEIPDKNKRLSTRGGIYSDAQIIGFRKNGYFSKDMKWRAAQEGLLPGEAMDKAIDAIIKADPAFAQRHNLLKTKNEIDRTKDVGESLINELKKAEGYKKITIGNIQSTLRWCGFDCLSLSQRQELYNTLTKVDPASTDTQEIYKQERIKILEAADAARNREMFTKPQAPTSFETVNEPIIEPTLNLKDLPQLEFDNQEDAQNIEFNTEPFTSK